MSLFISLALAAVFLAVIFFDLRQMRIPNQLSLILIVLFAVTAFGMPLSETGLRVLQALIVFALGFFGFMFRLLGGGDVKILAAIALFIPLSNASEIMLTFSVTLIAGTVFVLVWRKYFPTTQSDWAFRKTGKMPMGLPIGLAGCIAVLGPLAG